MLSIPSELPIRHEDTYRQNDSPFFDVNFIQSARPPATIASEVVVGGVSVAFNQPTQVGRYIDGSPWAVFNSGLQITQRLPAGEDGRNGTMVNISSGQSNGGDSRVKFHNYSHAANVLSAEKLPRDVAAGESYCLFVSKNRDIVGDESPFDEMQVLTIVETPPAPTEFRPHYYDSTKLVFTETQIDYTRVPNYPVTPSAGTLADAAAYFQSGPYCKIISGFADRYWHATKNHNTGSYAREVARTTGLAALRLVMSGTQEQKRPLVIGLIQSGIDIQGAVASGLRWDADGGHSQGAKLLVAIAAYLLNSPTLGAIADWGQTDVFQEDQQTAIVDASLVSITNSASWVPDTRPYSSGGAPLPYLSADIGRPIWAIRHYLQPQRSDMNWRAIYRTVSGSAQFVHCVAAYLMGLEQTWNHTAWFDFYLNRYYVVEAGLDGLETPMAGIGNFANQIDPAANEAYLTYINPAVATSLVPALSSRAGVLQTTVPVTAGLEPR